MHFQENISSYTAACYKIGLKPAEIFETNDLYQGKDMMKVVALILYTCSCIESTLFIGASTSTYNENEQRKIECRIFEVRPLRFYLSNPLLFILIFVLVLSARKQEGLSNTNEGNSNEAASIKRSNLSRSVAITKPLSPTASKCTVHLACLK